MLIGARTMRNPLEERYCLSCGAKLLSATPAESVRASALAVTLRPVGDEAGLARLAVCPLAAADREDSVSGPRATNARYFRWPLLDRGHSLSHEWHSRTYTSGFARPVTVSRAERAHLRDLWQQARRVFLQPRRCQPCGRLGSPPVLSPALFSCGHEFAGACWPDSLLFSPTP